MLIFSRKSSSALVVAEVPAAVLLVQVGPQRYPGAVFFAAVLQGTEVSLLVVSEPAGWPFELEAALMVRSEAGLLLPLLLQLFSELGELEPERIKVLLEFLLFLE